VGSGEQLYLTVGGSATAELHARIRGLPVGFDTSVRRWLQFMRYCVLHGYTYVHLCKTEDMIADSLTKVSSLHGYSTFVKVFFNIYK